MGRPRGKCTEETIRGPFYTKTDDYSLSGVRFQRKQVEFFCSLDVLHSRQWEEILTVFDPHIGIFMAQRSVIFLLC